MHVLGLILLSVAAASAVSVDSCPQVETPCTCPMRTGDDGCQTCVCHDDVPGSECSPTRCNVVNHSCVFGRDQKGCQTCECAPCPPLVCESGCRTAETEMGCAVCECGSVDSGPRNAGG